MKIFRTFAKNFQSNRMQAKTFIQKLCSRYLVLNLLAMAVVILVVMTGISLGASVYTHHGEAISVPDLTNKRIEDAERLAEADGLFITVTDTGYNKLLPPGCVLHQTPSPGSEVKSGRMVYVSINASKKPTLVVPDIIDNSSMREAMARLKILGFKVGEPQYIAGEKDWVYGVICRGRSLAPGDRVAVDAMVMLQVGNGMLSDADDYEYVDPDIESAGDDIMMTVGADSIAKTTVPQQQEDPFQIVEE